MDVAMKELIVSKMLQFIAPGTPLRDGIDNVLRAKTGGLIVVGYNDKVQKLVDGGFPLLVTGHRCDLDESESSSANVGKI
jgi:diadenylate cyclase